MEAKRKKFYYRSKTANQDKRHNMFNYINNGILEPYLDFRVDYFYGSSRGQHTFFLTHMHEGMDYYFQIVSNPHLIIDHLRGLTRKNDYGYSAPDESWAWGTIYTSFKSKALLIHRFPHLKPYVKGLDL